MFRWNTATNASQNNYLQVLLDKHFQALSINTPSLYATAEHALLTLMEHYHQESTRTYLGVKTNYRNHEQDAKKCIALLQGTRETALTDTIHYLNSIQFIKKGGDFSILLNTFFSIYPDHLNHCAASLKAVLSPLDCWQSDITSWVSKQTQHGITNHTNDFDMPEKFATIIPCDMAETYADALLAHLQNPEQPAYCTAIQQGWQYSALGKLQPKLPAAKQKEVSKFLTQQLATAKDDVSLIGLCEALIAYHGKHPLNQMAAINLYLYLTTDTERFNVLIPEEAGLDPQPNTFKAALALYGKKLLTVMKNYEQYLSPLQKNAVMHYLTKDENLYYFRMAINELHNWLDVSQVESIIQILACHLYSFELTPLFWPWLYNESDNSHTIPNATSLVKSHREYLERAEAILNEELRYPAPIASYITTLFKHPAAVVYPDSIIDNLLANMTRLSLATTRNPDLKINRQLNDIYLAVALLTPWLRMAKSPHRAIVTTILDSTRPMTVSREARVNGISFILTLNAELTDDDNAYIESTLISSLKRGSISAEQALLTYAQNSRWQALPALMTKLLTIDNFTAQALLLKVHQHYLSVAPRQEMTRGMGIGQ